MTGENLGTAAATELTGRSDGAATEHTPGTVTMDTNAEMQNPIIVGSTESYNIVIAGEPHASAKR